VDGLLLGLLSLEGRQYTFWSEWVRGASCENEWGKLFGWIRGVLYRIVLLFLRFCVGVGSRPMCFGELLVLEPMSFGW